MTPFIAGLLDMVRLLEEIIIYSGQYAAINLISYFSLSQTEETPESIAFPLAERANQLYLSDLALFQCPISVSQFNLPGL